MKIITSVNKLIAGRPLELVCQSSGSRPAARLVWLLARRSVTVNKLNISNIFANTGATTGSTGLEGVRVLDELGSSLSEDGLVTTSFLSFQPKVEDHQRVLFCVSANPQFALSNHFIYDQIQLDIQCKYKIVT